MKIKKIMSILLISVFMLFAASDYSFSKDVKMYSTSSGLMYLRVTEAIYNDSILMDSGKRKYPTKGNTFAQIMINFANLTDKPVADYGLNPVDLTVEPQTMYVVGKSGKFYSGMNATKFLRKDLKPFLEQKKLKPGEDIVVAMAFHVPKNDKIAGVVYQFKGGYKLSINFD